MLYNRTNPTGVDVPIQKAQKLLHSRLSSLYCKDIKAYGRAYLKKSGDNLYPEVYVDGIDYKNVLGLDDNRFFFVQSNVANKVNNTWYETDVSIYFIVNLKELKPLVSHRADEEVHNDIDFILSKTDFYDISLEMGIDNFLKDFNIPDNDNFNTADVEPNHVFKFNCSVRYNLATTKCNV